MADKVEKIDLDEEEGNCILGEALAIAPAHWVEKIAVHGATFGVGTEEHSACIVSFVVGDMLANFALSVEATEAFVAGLSACVPLMKEKDAELKLSRH